MAREAAVTALLEVGSGSILSGLNRRIVTGVQTASLSEPDQLKKLLEASNSPERKTTVQLKLAALAKGRPSYELAEEAIAEWLQQHQREIGRAAAEISRGGGKS